MLGLSVLTAVVTGLHSLTAPGVALPVPDVASAAYEAENATLSQAVVDDKHAGFSGAGFVDYVNAPGGYVEFTVTVAAPGNADLVVRYANAAPADRPLDITVNGSVVATGSPFISTGAWDDWREVTVKAPLRAGTNKVRLTATAAAGGPNLDRLTVKTTESPMVTSVSALRSAIEEATPGQRIVVADGRYSVDDDIPIKQKTGVTITAQTVGGVTFTGTGTFVLDRSSRVSIEGFVFRQRVGLTVPAGSTHVRIARNVFRLNESSTDKINWLTVEGDDAEIANNTFMNKTTHGVFLQVTGAGSTMAQRVAIRRNHFYNHQWTDNGGESIRLGYGDKGRVPAHAVVEYNLFEKAEGDDEALSVKSSNNVIRANTILGGKRGSLTLRAGDRTTVEGNFLIGGPIGLRIYGGRHTIVNNYIAGAGTDGIVLGAGYDDKHDRAAGIRLLFNTVVNAGGLAVRVQGGANPAKDCTIANNILVRPAAGALLRLGGAEHTTVNGNMLWDTVAGSDKRDPRLVQDTAGTYRLGPASPAIDASKGSYPEVKTDMDQQPRTSIPDVGADERHPGPGTGPLTRADVGPAGH
ncbi:chondroitinase-B domain-containing protein [Streptosporangium sp. CA-135522]|uniref:chondroitinase-B domain-containing protein n=1 Tax=Streptosporangium sp. CA-135522 TaxID=3240072 RepID=UPI003D8C81C0